MLARFFRPVSIKTQLLLAVVVATAVASLVSAGFSVWREIGTYAETRRLEAHGAAGLFASTSVEAIRSRDEGRAFQTLRAMKSMPGVVYVRLADASGATVAEHGFGARLIGGDSPEGAVREPGFLALLSGEPLLVSTDVTHGGERIGSVELMMSTDDLMRRIWSLLTSAALATLLAVGLGFLAARSFRRGVSGRIEAVAGAMSVVRRTHHYETALPNERQDELGVLIDGFNGMMREIKVRDRKLADHRDNLETEVRHRTHDLVIAKQSADDANHAKSQFLATMSHEIRTPLNGLMVMAELLAAADLEKRERRYADVIMRSGGTLLAIINDVLDFSKIEAGKIELEAIPLDLADVIDDVCQLFASKAAGQGLDLAAYIAPSVGEVMGDPVRIGQIVSNLVNNAIKFTAQGHVLVEAGEDPSRPGHVLISVTDTGIGIAPEKLGAVFESFSQADQSTARRYGGTGLGLSICKKLVTVMGGEIGVESMVGVGSRFWFSVPLARVADISQPTLAPFVLIGADRAARRALERYGEGPGGGAPMPGIAIVDPAATGARAAAAAHSANGGKIIVLSRVGETTADAWLAEGLATAALAWPIRRRDLVQTLENVLSGKAVEHQSGQRDTSRARYARSRVLVVDDSPVNREVATEALKRFGIVAETANDGLEALARAGAGGHDLILMDGSMPGLDGFEASRAIRAEEGRLGLKRQPIVALTAHAMGDGLEAWREAEMDGLLVKPFSLSQLAACLAQHLTPDAEGAARIEAQAEADVVSPPPASDGASSVLNPETMATLAFMAAADAAPVRRIVALFIEHSGPALATVEEHILAGKASELASSVHALKSMALSVGAQALAAMLAPLEKAARASGECPDAGVVEAIRRQRETAIEALQRQPWMQDAAKADNDLAA
jgi:signal transduction histidine kinase/CheY-like chemotaxis protein/HPt (histidine-containing phosphotransfer) domain-containing protein